MFALEVDVDFSWGEVIQGAHDGIYNNWEDTAEDVKDNDTATNGFVDSYLLCFISFFWGIIYKRAGESLSVLDGTKYGNYTVFMRYSFDIQ